MSVVLALLAGVALCGTGPGQPACAGADAGWQQAITPTDLTRLHDWREAFVKALAEAKAAGHEQEVAAEGPLLDPDAAIDGAELPPGTYRCRTIKLGSQGDGGLGYVPYPSFDCRVGVEGTRTVFTKLNGSQRPTGTLYPPATRRQVFLGVLVLGDETRALSYGRDPERNMVGAVERIGPSRWRLVLPYPRFESTLDVIELVPAS
jgi:hypothetical protein